MSIHHNTKSYHSNIGSFLFNFGVLAGLATIAFGLISCGGGGGAAGTQSNPESSALTIDSITPTGMVASSVAKTLTLVGSNFASGVSVSIASSSGVTAGYTINSSSVSSATVMTVNVTIPSAPVDNYVVLSLNKASGTPVTHVLGVAGTNQTVSNGIQSLFTTRCAGCHNGTGSDKLDLRNATIGNTIGVIGYPSIGCSPKLRTTPGDPRRASSVLIDKIKAASGVAACSGASMPISGTLSDAEIQALIDWVAGGAR